MVLINTLCTFFCQDSAEASAQDLDQLACDFCMLTRFLQLENEADPADTLLRMQIVDDAALARNPCNWAYVGCDDHRVTDIMWEKSYLYGRNFDIRAFDTSWLPPSVITVEMSGHGGNSELYIEHLPKNIESVLMSNCSLYGTPNFQFLSDSCQYMNLARNYFRGTLLLTNFPTKLQTVFLDGSQFAALIVDVTAMGESATKWCLQRQCGKKPMRVRCVRGSKVPSNVEL